MLNTGRLRRRRRRPGTTWSPRKLKSLRNQRVWTIERLAAEAGVSKNTVSKAERGGSIYPSSVHKIASALGVEPSELVKAG